MNEEADRPEQYFYHRPFSIRVKEVRRLDDVRGLPATETLLTYNMGFDKKSAREIIMLLLPFVMNCEPGIDMVYVTSEGLVP